MYLILSADTGRWPKMYSVPDKMMGDALLGPNAEYIKFVTIDDHEFIIKKDIVFRISPKIRTMMESKVCIVDSDTECAMPMQHFKSHIVQQFCIFFIYWRKYSLTIHTEPIPKFPIAHTDALDMMQIAHFFELWAAVGASVGWIVLRMMGYIYWSRSRHEMHVVLCGCI